MENCFAWDYEQSISKYSEVKPKKKQKKKWDYGSVPTF